MPLLFERRIHMAQVIDISGRIKNQPKFIKIGKKSYRVDDRKNTILEIMQIMDEEGSGDIATIDKVIGKLLGANAKKELDYSLEDYQTIFIACMAAVQGVTFEECENSFRREK